MGPPKSKFDADFTRKKLETDFSCSVFLPVQPKILLGGTVQQGQRQFIFYPDPGL